MPGLLAHAPMTRRYADGTPGMEILPPGPAREMARHGRDGDTLMAHITPEEAGLLKRMGGRGTINPKTGALEFAKNYGANAGYNKNIDAYLSGLGLATPDAYGGGALNALKASNPQVADALTRFDPGKDYSAPAPTSTTPQPSAPSTPAPAYTPRDESVTSNLDKILAKDSPLMRRAESQGLMTANRRGLLNSSMAAEAAQAALIDRAAPLAGQEASQAHAANLSRQGFEQNRVIQGDALMTQERIALAQIAAEKEMLGQQLSHDEAMALQDYRLQLELQGNEIGSQQWIAQLDADTRQSLAQLDADTRETIAGLQVGASDRNQIANMMAAAEQNYTAAYQSILSNPDIPADQRQAEIDHIGQLMQDQINMIEALFGVQIEWSPP